MTIKVNGQQHEAAADSTISSLLDDLGLAGKPVVVEHNKTALFPRDYDTATLSDDDSVEIITIAAGG